MGARSYREGPYFDNEGRCRLLPEIAGITEEAIKDRNRQNS
jgi:hypothetical protein